NLAVWMGDDHAGNRAGRFGGGPRRWPAHCLSYDGGRRLVLAQRLERGMAQHAIRRPVAELDFADQFRPHPDRAGPAFLRYSVVGRLRDFHAHQPRAQFGGRLGREAGTDMPGITQEAALVITEQQRADPALARAFALGEAANDEFLPLDAFRLEPVADPARAIGRVGAFRHDAFEPLLSRFLEDRVARALDMVGIAQRARLGLFRDQGTEQFLARAEGSAAQILAVEIEQVERDQREPAAMPFAERLLQVAEIGAALGIE